MKKEFIIKECGIDDKINKAQRDVDNLTLKLSEQ